MSKRIYTLAQTNPVQLIELSKKFYSLTGLKGEFHGDTFLRFWEECLTRGLSAMWVHEVEGNLVGAIGMTLSLSIMDGSSTAEESFWFVDPAHRGTVGLRLYRDAEKWAKEQGVHRLVMGHMTMSMPNKVAKFYTRQGFMKLQTTYTKEL